MPSTQPRFQRPHAASLDAISGSSSVLLFWPKRPGEILYPQKGAKNKNFCVSCAFLWPFLFLYTGHSTREGLISAYTYKRYYKRQPERRRDARECLQRGSGNVETISELRSWTTLARMNNRQ